MEIILIIIMGTWVYGLSKRIQTLEQKLDHATISYRQTERVMTGVERAALDVLEKREEVQAPLRVLANDLSPAPASPHPDVLTRFSAWVQEEFMMKLGAFLMLCALGWFVSYAFMHNYIGEAGRIALGLVTGTVFLILGYWRIERARHQGGIFTVLGSTIILLTVYAGRELYDFFTPVSALGLMLLSTAFVALVAVRWNSERLALASLILASIAPLFTSSDYPDVIERFTYLLIIVVGTLSVAFMRGWSTLTFGALVSVFLHGLPYLTGIATGDRDVVLLFAFVFTAIFFGANICGLMMETSESQRTAQFLTAGGTGLYLIVWILFVAAKEWQSLLFVLWMLVFSLGSFIVYRLTDRPEPFYLYGVTSIALLGAATASELDGAALTIAFTIEIAMLALLALRIMRTTEIGTALTVLFVVPVLMSFGALISSEWGGGVLHDSFFVLVVLMCALTLVGLELRALKTPTEQTEDAMSTLLLACAGFYAVALVWLVLHAGAYLADDTATLFALCIYAVVGIACFTRGRSHNVPALTYTGGILIALVMGRLLLIEVWNMELTGRIITFFVIGLLFLSTAFLRRKPDDAVSTKLPQS